MIFFWILLLLKEQKGRTPGIQCSHTTSKSKHPILPKYEFASVNEDRSLLYLKDALALGNMTRCTRTKRWNTWNRINVSSGHPKMYGSLHMWIFDPTNKAAIGCKYSNKIVHDISKPDSIFVTRLKAQDPHSACNWPQPRYISWSLVALVAANNGDTPKWKQHKTAKESP